MLPEVELTEDMKTITFYSNRTVQHPATFNLHKGAIGSDYSPLCVDPRDPTTLWSYQPCQSSNIKRGNRSVQLSLAVKAMAPMHDPIFQKRTIHGPAASPNLLIFVAVVIGPSIISIRLFITFIVDGIATSLAARTMVMGMMTSSTFRLLVLRQDGKEAFLYFASLHVGRLRRDKLLVKVVVLHGVF
jgi:hypothetical protein